MIDEDFIDEFNDINVDNTCRWLTDVKLKKNQFIVIAICWNCLF